MWRCGGVEGWRGRGGGVRVEGRLGWRSEDGVERWRWSGGGWRC